MCELLGMSANVPTDICFSFTGLVQRGVVQRGGGTGLVQRGGGTGPHKDGGGGTGPHKDGWGITFYEGKGCRTFNKDPQPI